MLIDAIGIQAGTESAGGPPWVQIVLAAISSMTMVVTALFAGGAFRRSGRAEKVAAEVLDNVNNVGKGNPTLVQRVGKLEHGVSTLKRRHDADGRWMHDSLKAIGEQIGASLPDRRDYDPEVES